ncbi:MAG: hypothetical protein AB1Z23_02265 [Eubacteriales bacterium]
MVEIFVVYSICKKTVENAKARGKKTGIAVLYTILLWLGMEFYGAFYSAFLLGYFGVYEKLNLLVYVFALGFAAIGGYLAVLISKVAKPIHAESSSTSSYSAVGNLGFSLTRDLRKGVDDISKPWDKR